MNYLNENLVYYAERVCKARNRALSDLWTMNDLGTIAFKNGLIISLNKNFYAAYEEIAAITKTTPEYVKAVLHHRLNESPVRTSRWGT